MSKPEIKTAGDRGPHCFQWNAEGDYLFGDRTNGDSVVLAHGFDRERVAGNAAVVLEWAASEARRIERECRLARESPARKRARRAWRGIVGAWWGLCDCVGLVCYLPVYWRERVILAKAAKAEADEIERRFFDENSM